MIQKCLFSFSILFENIKCLTALNTEHLMYFKVILFLLKSPRFFSFPHPRISLPPCDFNTLAFNITDADQTEAPCFSPHNKGLDQTVIVWSQLGPTVSFTR